MCRELMFCSLYLFSVAVNAENVLQVLDAAFKEDSQFKKAEYKVNQVDAGKNIARSELLPQISAKASRSKNTLDIKETTSNVFQLGEQEFESIDYSVTITQSIYDYGKWAELEKQQALLRKSRAEFVLAKQELIIRVIQAYSDVIIAQNSMVLAKYELSLSRKKSEYLKNKFDLKLARYSDYLKSKSQVDQMNASFVEEMISLEIARNILIDITGLDFDSLTPLDIDMIFVDETVEINNWLEIVRRGNAELIMSKSDYIATNKAVNAQRGRHYPSLELIAEYEDSDEEGGSIGGRKQNEASIQLQLNIPIWSGGATQGRVNRELAAKNIAYEDYMLVSKRLNNETRKAFLSIKSGLLKRKSFKRAQKSARLVTLAIKQGLSSGSNALIELMEAERDELKFLRDSVQVKNELILAKVEMLKLSGQLTLDHIVIH
jgi:outer membrane protein